MKRRRVLYISGAVFLLALIVWAIVSARDGDALVSPSGAHWCGTGIFGEDILAETLLATGVEILTLLAVSAMVWILGIVIGALLSMPANRFVRELFMSLIHLLATLPVLLLALFLLILFGGGIVNAILILTIAALPSQVLFAYNHLESAKKEAFYLAKRSYGLSPRYLLKNHLLPYIFPRYNNYTLSRLPEITMMSLAIDFLGLGVKAPIPSLGRMLFDGMSFMFSAWWLWLFPVISVVLVFSVLSGYGKKYRTRGRITRY